MGGVDINCLVSSIKWWLLVICVIGSTAVMAQLQVPPPAVRQASHPVALRQAILLPSEDGTRVPAQFDFANAKPHLAFFCRLELDIEAATRFPVRFRLGEVTGWQQRLTKRD
jgi:hypothetical protein